MLGTKKGAPKKGIEWGRVWDLTGNHDDLLPI